MPRIRSRRINWRRTARTPGARLVVAILLMVGGGWLIGLWMVGIMLMLAGLGLGADALLQDDGATRKPLPTHEDVLERYRQAR